MRIHRLAIGAIAAIGLTLSACAGGAGAGTQSASAAASGGEASAASGTERSSSGQSADADSALSVDSAASSASSAGGADAPASAPSAAGGSQGGLADIVEDAKQVDVTTIVDVTHIPEGYEKGSSPDGGIQYEKGRESAFFMTAFEGKLPPNLPIVEAFKQMSLSGVDANSVKEGDKVASSDLEFRTAYSAVEMDGKKGGAALALAERDGKTIVVLFAAPGQGDGTAEVDPALVKSVLEGIKWK